MNTFSDENENDQKLDDGVRKGVTRRQFLGLAGGAAAAVALGGGAAGLLAGCSSSTTTTSSTSATTGSTGPATPKYGGTLRIDSVSPGTNIGWPAAMTGGGTIAQAYYETLLRSDQKGNLNPWLAESFKVGDDKKSITFTIRKGVKFSDGSDLTADVVEWNLEQFAKTQTSWTTIEVVDPNTVRVNFKAWDFSLPATFGDNEPALCMVSKTAYDKNGQQWMTTHPVGTGPFTVESFVTDASMKLVKNPNYWGTDAKSGKLPYLDGVNFTFTTDTTTALMMAKSGDVDMVLQTLSPDQLVKYKEMKWTVRHSYESNDVWVPDSAHADSPWSKLEVREAAEYAIDRATIADKFGYSYLKAPYQIPPRDTTAYDPNYASARKYDPAKAKQLLAQAGYPNGFKTKLIVWQGGDKNIALAEQQYLLAVGIQAEVEFPDAGKFISYIGPTGNYHNAILEAVLPSQGPSGIGSASYAVFLYGNNISKPAEFTQALSAATSAPTPDVTLIRAATDLLSKNALVIPVYEVGSSRVDQSYVVCDFGHRGIPSSLSLETAWLNK